MRRRSVLRNPDHGNDRDNDRDNDAPAWDFIVTLRPGRRCNCQGRCVKSARGSPIRTRGFAKHNSYVSRLHRVAMVSVNDECPWQVPMCLHRVSIMSVNDEFLWASVDASANIPRFIPCSLSRLIGYDQCGRVFFRNEPKPPRAALVAATRNHNCNTNKYARDIPQVPIILWPAW